MDILSLKKILSLLLEAETKTKARIEKYIDIQNSSILINFSDDEQTRKAEYSKLKSFSVKLVNDIESADVYAAKLSTLVCEADQERNNDLTLKLIRIFDGYCAWKEAAEGFIAKSEIIFENNNKNKYALLFSEARMLLAATDALCNLINNEILNISKQ
jgi:hypothetical protein